MGAPLPTVDFVYRFVAERADGRRALLEMGRPSGPEPLDTWLLKLVDEVEAWSDVGGFLTVLAAGPVGGTGWVARVVEAPRGQVAGALTARPVPPARVVAIGLGLGRALASAHARGLAHGGIRLGHVHLRDDEVEVEPGGFASLLGAGPASRADDVEAFGDLLRALLAGQRGLPVPPSVPADLQDLVLRALDPSPLTRPPIAQLVAALRELEGRFGQDSEEATPSTASRSVVPRLEDMVAMRPPTPPSAPSVRSVVPATERQVVAAPAIKRSEVPGWAMAAAGGLLLAMLTLLALWWLA